MSLEITIQGAAVSPAVAGPASNRASAQFANKGQRPGNRRSWGWTVLLGICAVALFDWLSAGTQRLYVDEDSAAHQQEGTVWQHFGVRGNEVVPEIISRDEARFTFPISLRRPHTLRFTAHPEGMAEYEIFWRTGETSRKLASRQIGQASSATVSVPAGKGELKFIVHGNIAWFDLRLVRQFPWPVYLGVFLLVAFALKKSGSFGVVSPRAGNWLALGGTSLLCLGLMKSSSESSNSNCLLRF